MSYMTPGIWAKITAAGAVENFTKMEDREMPATPRTIMTMGRFSTNRIFAPSPAGASRPCSFDSNVHEIPAFVNINDKQLCPAF